MAEFTVNNKKYRNTKLSAFEQFHILRRMGTLFPSVVGALSIHKKDPMLAISYITTALSKLSDDDCNFILRGSLGSCQLDQSGNGSLWVNIFANGNLMFDDMPMQEMLQITWYVLEDNFRDFFHALLQRFPTSQV